MGHKASIDEVDHSIQCIPQEIPKPTIVNENPYGIIHLRRHAPTRDSMHITRFLFPPKRWIQQTFRAVMQDTPKGVGHNDEDVDLGNHVY